MQVMVRGEGVSADAPPPSGSDFLKELARVDLVTELYKFVTDHARASARNRFDADDLLQEMLITILEVTDRYTHLTRPELVAVAKTAARNRVRELMRNRNRRAKYHVSLDEARDAMAFDEDRLRMVRDMLNQVKLAVDVRTRKMVSIAMKSDNMAEVARQLGISQSTVSRAFRDARLMMYILHDEKGDL